MSEIIDLITHHDNLRWAWKKAKMAYQIGEIWFDEIELAGFEANLSNELDNIKNEIKSGHYQITPIKPVPYPKSNDKDGNNRTRQTFFVSIKDQIAWLSVLNIIGADLDYQMPSWSYGHRLFVSIWFEQKIDGGRDIKIGWYRNSSGYIYRKWNQSWPLFRRHISITTKIMSKAEKFNKTRAEFIETEINNDIEKDALINNENFQNNLKVKYLTKGYWENRTVDKLYWAGIDFEKFYPLVNLNAIKSNIFKYTSIENQDDEFINLITQLLQFPIDLSGWTEDELGENGIGIGNDLFLKGIPTGLFVAGFLANIALLDVDKVIEKELETNKEIAHFRFVDDHIILSYDFDKLVSWVKYYNEILNSYNTGAKFNFNKIEPTEFSEYLQDDSNELKKTAAIKVTELDPEFPTPLMTQTLAKVSAISNTDFNLLSEGEENQLITDLEHLLITDFPDNELRKDTRISFAATMLSRIVPRKKYDYSQIYYFRKKCFHIVKELAEGLSKIDSIDFSKITKQLLFEQRSNSEADNFIKELKEAIQSELILKDISIITKGRYDNDKIYEIVKNLHESKQHEIEHFNKINSESLSLKGHVFKLILKAIKENHQKVRLWLRLIEYCSKTGYCPIIEIFDEIEKLYKKNLTSKLSAGFLYSLVLMILTDRIFASIALITSGKNISSNEKENIIKFLKAIFEDHLLSDIFDKQTFEEKYYFKKSYDIFRVALGTALYILSSDDLKIIDIPKESLIKKYNLINWEDSPNDWFSINSYKINTWLYWILQKTHFRSDVHAKQFWLYFQKYIDFESSDYIPLIISFPEFNNLNSIFRNNIDLFDRLPLNVNNEGWLFDLIKTSHVNTFSVNFLKNCKSTYPGLYSNIKSKRTKYSSLYDWIQWSGYFKQGKLANSQSKINSFFDPRLTEWSALEIIKQIIYLSKVSATDFFFTLDATFNQPIHPANYLIPIEWQVDRSFSWHEWKDWITKYKIKKRPLEELISDERYSNQTLKDDYQNSSLSMVHGFALILVQLISNETSLPWVWNETDKNLIWSNTIAQKIQDSNISSFTHLILQSCFSTRNRETLFWVNNKIKVSDFFADDDTQKDPPLIKDIDDLLTCIEYSQKNLVNYQISVQGNMPRQLIPINLIQLSSSNNPFNID